MNPRIDDTFIYFAPLELAFLTLVIFYKYFATLSLFR
jgi:hypothetical protein